MRTTLAVVAILAALFGAPSTAVAKAPNQLSAPGATPHNGTTATTFVLSVAYLGRQADEVHAIVAGRTLAMSLQTGSPSSGGWAVATTLPAGTWPVTFSAEAGTGNSPSLAGPTLHVTGIASTTDGPTPTQPAGGSEGGGGGGGGVPEELPGSPAAPRATPAAAPIETHAEVNGLTPPEPVQPAPAASMTVPAEDDGALASPAEIGASPTAPAGALADAARAPDASHAGSITSGAEVDVSAVEESVEEPEAPVGILVVSLSGAAAIALVAVALLLASRRRRQPEPEPATSPAEATAALLERRAVRHAGRVIGEDPIVAALGITTDRPTRRAGRQVSHGPGERVTAARRTPRSD